MGKVVTTATVSLDDRNLVIASRVSRPPMADAAHRPTSPS
jgi:hypothetical protein